MYVYVFCDFIFFSGLVHLFVIIFNLSVISFFFFFHLLFLWKPFLHFFSFGVGFGIFSRSAQVPIKQYFKFINSHCPYIVSYRIVYMKRKKTSSPPFTPDIFRDDPIFFFIF